MRRLSPRTFDAARSIRPSRTPLSLHISRWTSSSAIPPIPRGSVHHDDLTSFLRHAQTTGLSATSTVYIGTHYEYTAINSLRRLGFTLTRTGRSADLGIDLVGEWRVPSSPVPLRTIMQCKARSRKLAPESVRELEGAFAGAPAGWRADGTVGFLVAAEAATKGVREALGRSRLPLGFVQVGREGDVKQMLWNRVAGDGGLEEMGVTLRHRASKIDDAEKGSGIRTEPDIILTYAGKALPYTPTVDEERGTVRKRGRPRKSDNKAEDTA